MNRIPHQFIRVLRMLVASLMALGWSVAGWAGEAGAGALGPDVKDGLPGPSAASQVTGAVGRTTTPTAAQTVFVAPRFGIIQLTTAGKQTTEVGAPAWQWPQPTLTMPPPVDFLGGHAPAWRAVAEAEVKIQAAQQAAAAGQGGQALPPPTVDLIGSQGKKEVPAAQLAWHRQSFADPAKLRAWLTRLNARDKTSHAQAIQFYAHTVELGVIDPKGGPDGTAAYQDCFVAVEVRPLLVGGGFESEPVLIENQPVKEVHAKYWLDCGFAEPVEEKFVFTNLRRIKLQLPQRRRNFLGFLHWLNGDWLEIVEDKEIAGEKPVSSLDFGSEAEFLAALQTLRDRYKDRKPQLARVELNTNLRDRIAAAFHGLDGDKE